MQTTATILYVCSCTRDEPLLLFLSLSRLQDPRLATSGQIFVSRFRSSFCPAQPGLSLIAYNPFGTETPFLGTNHLKLKWDGSCSKARGLSFAE